MKPINSLPIGMEAILWGPECGYFIGTMSTPSQYDPEEYSFDEDAEYLFWEDNEFRDDYPKVTQWSELPDPSVICARCGEVCEEYITMATPLGWRHTHFLGECKDS